MQLRRHSLSIGSVMQQKYDGYKKLRGTSGFSSSRQKFFWWYLVVFVATKMLTGTTNFYFQLNNSLS